MEGDKYWEGQSVNANENQTNNAGDDCCEDNGMTAEVPLEANGGVSKITFVCPECQHEKDHRQRPVQEVVCRHTKCRQCYIASENGCRQCSGDIPVSTREKTQSPANSNTDSGISGGGDENEQGCYNYENCHPPPPATAATDETLAQMDSGVERRFDFEVEQSSGVKIRVNVSWATLKELGVQFEDSEGNDVSKSSDELPVGDGDVLTDDSANLVRDETNSNEVKFDGVDMDDGVLTDEENEIKVDEVDMKAPISTDEENEVKADDQNMNVSTDVKPVIKVEIVDIDVSEEEHSAAPLAAADISLDRKPTTRHAKKRNGSKKMTTASPPKLKKITKKEKKKVRKLMDHIIKLEPEEDYDDQPGFRCLKCMTDFYKFSQRLSHVYCNPANGRSPYICKFCSKRCANGSHLLYHERSNHTGEKPFSCHICDRRFYLKVKLNRHMVMHDKSLAKPQNQRERPKRYTCAYCSKKFPSMCTLKRHFSSHTEGRPYQCTLCQKNFKTREILNCHIKYHDASKERAYKCSLCDLAFSYEKDLKRHGLTHSKEYNFVCPLCNAKTKRKDNFMRHLRNTHKLSEEVRKQLCEDALGAMRR